MIVVTLQPRRGHRIGPPALDAGGQFRTPATMRARLRISTPEPVSLNVTGNIRATFETLARMGGINVVFGGAFPTRTHTFQIEKVEYFDALDTLATATNTFWQPFNENTILVYSETPQNRRDFEWQVMETVYLPGTV